MEEKAIIRLKNEDGNIRDYPDVRDDIIDLLGKEWINTGTGAFIVSKEDIQKLCDRIAEHCSNVPEDMVPKRAWELLKTNVLWQREERKKLVKRLEEMTEIATRAAEIAQDTLPKKKGSEEYQVQLIGNACDLYPGMYEGSVFTVTKETKLRYKGLWSSRAGTYNVSVPKVRCKPYIDMFMFN